MVSEHAPIDTQRLRQLFKQLVDIYSPSGKEEDILDYLYGYFRQRGLQAVKQPVDDRRYNLLLVPEETDVQLAFIGHLDTVPAHDLDDYGYWEEGDEIYGLGTADMKGGCAAMIEAYMAAAQASMLPPAAALALVVGEEEEGDGAQRLVKDYHFPWALIGEPTDLRLALSHFGYLELHLVARGRRMHASLASRDHNPVEAMLHLLLRISHYWESDRPDVVTNIRDLSSASGGFVVPELCEAWLDVHVPPAAPIGEIAFELEQIVQKAQEQNPNLELSLRFTTIHSGYEIPERGTMVERLKPAFERHGLPWQPEPFRSHSDANFLWSAGIKPMLLGPGQLEKAHTADESVSFHQVCLAAELYADILLSLND